MHAAVLGPELVVQLLLGVAAIQPVLGYEKKAEMKEMLRYIREINNYEVLKGHRHGEISGENKKAFWYFLQII